MTHLVFYYTLPQGGYNGTGEFRVRKCAEGFEKSEIVFNVTAWKSKNLQGYRVVVVDSGSSIRTEGLVVGSYTSRISETR